MFGRSRITEVAPAQAHSLQQQGATLLDVRDDHEWRAGHAPEAIHMPLHRLSELPAAVRDTTVLTVCRSGQRSAQAAKALVAAGIDARNVTGGMSAWARKGLPVVSETGAGGRVI